MKVSLLQIKTAPTPEENIIQRFRSQKTLFKEYEATNIPIIKIHNKSNIKKLTIQIHNALNKIK